MNMQLLAVVILTLPIVFVLSAPTAPQCTSNAQCPYGECNLTLRKCQCKVRCHEFEPKFYCGTGKAHPQLLCKLLSEACEQQANVTFRELTAKEMVTFICDQNSSVKKEFCEDQSYCSGQGICLRDAPGSPPYCICRQKSETERCSRNRRFTESYNIGQLNSVSSLSPPHASNERDKPENSTSMHQSGSIYAVVGLLPCMLLCCYLVYRYRKRANNTAQESVNEASTFPPSLQTTDHNLLQLSQIKRGDDDNKHDDVIEKSHQSHKENLPHKSAASSSH